MWYRFTEKLRHTTHTAQDEAKRFHTNIIDVDHLALSMLRDPRTAACQILTSLSLSPPDLCAQLEKRLVRTDVADLLSDFGSTPEFSLSQSALRVIVQGHTEARRIGCDYISTAHVLFGVVRDDTSHTASLLRREGVTEESLRALVAGWVKEQAEGVPHRPLVTQLQGAISPDEWQRVTTEGIPLSELPDSLRDAVLHALQESIGGKGAYPMLTDAIVHVQASSDTETPQSQLSIRLFLDVETPAD